MGYNVGTLISEAAYILKASVQTTKRNTPFLNFDCRLIDGTEYYGCKVWNWDEDRPVPSGLVYVLGRVDTFNGNLQIIAEDIDTETVEGVTEEDFYAKAPGDLVIDDEIKEFRRHVLSIKNTRLMHFVESVLRYWSFHLFPGLESVDENLFYSHPGAQSVHHAYKGGLLHHTNEVIAITRSIVETILEQEGRDLAIAGAVLHDIGKMVEFNVVGAASEYSLAGFCFGNTSNAHLYIGSAMLNIVYNKEIGKSDMIDTKTFLLLNNIVLSHHGDYGDVKPASLAAEYVHFADNASAKKGLHDGYFDKNKADTRFARSMYERAYVKLSE